MKISCVIPVLNEEENVQNFLDSYLIQREKFYELIFVAGQCKDKSIEIIEKYKKKNTEIKLISCDKKGPSAARNKGIDNSTGEYITFMDADWKFLNEDSIKKIIQYSENVNEVIFYTIYNNRTIKYNGIRKYIYLKDKNVAFAIIKKNKCPKFDEELGFGEDRIFYDIDLNKLKNERVKLTDNEIGISRAEGTMDVSKLLKRYMWYGRTIPKYLNKSRDWKYAIGYIIYILSIIPVFWIIPFIRGFIRGIKEIRYGIDAPFGMGIVEILTAIGISLGFLQWLIGIKEIGRDV